MSQNLKKVLSYHTKVLSSEISRIAETPYTRIYFKIYLECFQTLKAFKNIFQCLNIFQKCFSIFNYLNMLRNFISKNTFSVFRKISNWHIVHDT